MTTKIAQSLSSTVTLNDGTLMPMFGLGVFKITQVQDVVAHAIKNGYKLIDTATYYQNEADVGRAIKDSGVKREDIFIVTKLPWDSHGRQKCTNAINNSLNKLDLDYIDLYLIHSPTGGSILDTYDTILEFQKQGKIRSVGVSNFGVTHLQELAKANRQRPSVNQIELHPWQQRSELVQYCKDNNITVMGFSPLAKAKKLQDEALIEIAKKYKKSTAQTLIRWSVQKGFITIPKSSEPSRIEANADVFSWSISDEDLKILDSFPTWSCTSDRTGCEWMP